MRNIWASKQIFGQFCIRPPPQIVSVSYGYDYDTRNKVFPTLFHTLLIRTVCIHTKNERTPAAGCSIPPC